MGKIRKFLQFEKARDYVHSLKLKSGKDWKEFCKQDSFPDNIPKAPYSVFKDKGWKGLGDWLGTGTVANQMREYFPFKEARDYAHSLKLESRKEWKEFCKQDDFPDNIHKAPASAFKDKGWKGWGDWLGTDTVSTQLREYLSFQEARGYAHSLKLKSGKEWTEFCKQDSFPDNIHKNPASAFKDKGWKGSGDWLGTGALSNQDREFLPFKEARDYAHSLKLKSEKEWKEFCKQDDLPNNIYKDPPGAFKDKGWKGWGDWLGTGTVAPQYRKYLSFQEAREYTHSLKLKSGKEWTEFCKQDSFPACIFIRAARTFGDII